MQGAKTIGFPVVGAIFLALAALKFVNGGNWVVWACLGVVFGGLSVFSRRNEGGGRS